MELKHSKTFLTVEFEQLLIVPYGIETQQTLVGHLLFGRF